MIRKTVLVQELFLFATFCPIILKLKKPVKIDFIFGKISQIIFLGIKLQGNLMLFS